MSDETLALFGGTPLVHDHASLRISWPVVARGSRKAVIDALNRMDFSGRGSKEVLELEREMAEYFGMPFATAVNSGTSALHVALASLGIKKEDEVIVPNLSFIATAVAVIHHGSIPVFADIDPRTYNITAETIVQKITERTRAVIVVHLHGFPADIASIQELCSRHGLLLIEDVAQAPGARFRGQLLGSFGDASAFSLMSQKNLATCGECGVVLHRTLLAKNRAEMVKIYGEILTPNKPREYNSFTLGWNYTLNPIQATMARTQLKSFHRLTSHIQRAGRALTKSLKPFQWILPPREQDDTEGVFHFYRVRFDGSCFGFFDSGRFRQAVQDALNAEGLHVRHYQNTPLSGQSLFQSAEYVHRREDFDLKHYPHTLDVIRSTAILGAIGSSPSYLLCPGTIEAYVRGFEKIERNMPRVIEYAKRIEYKEPWESLSKISDSFGAVYGLQTP